MMDMNIKSYLKIYHDWVDVDKCEKAIEELQNCQWRQHTFYSPIENGAVAISGDKELDITFDNLSVTPYLMQKIWDAYHQYLKDLNFFWFHGWAGYSNVKYNRYKPGRLMAMHCDNINSVFDGERKGIPTMTALGFLNDDFEGGDFIMWDETIKIKRGDMMVFPSMFLYPHKVEEVTKGERYTFVSWAW